MGDVITVVPNNPPIGGYVITDADGREVNADGTYVVTGDGFTPFTVTATHVIAEIPVPAKGLEYNRKSQTGVYPVAGSVLSGHTSGTAAGKYTAYATLEEGYVWPDGTFGKKTIVWYIAKAKVVPLGVVPLTQSDVENGTSPEETYTTLRSKTVPPQSDPMRDRSICSTRTTTNGTTEPPPPRTSPW